MKYQSNHLLLGLLSAVVLTWQPLMGLGEDLTAEQREFFENRIRPVLVEYCYECHSPDAKTLQANFSLHTREGFLVGGDSGPAIVPGKVDEGTLLESLRYETFGMPPAGKLPDRVIADFETWIKMGAPDPRSGPAIATRSGIDLEEGRQFWAFVPPINPVVPRVQQPDQIQQPLDAFILRKLEAEELALAPRASKQVLVRRLYYDLIGLPPTPAQIQSFLDDESPFAYERLVDQLLSSKEFGERWGRHWLDVARYADSTGGGRSRLYGNSWRYRDYVINAFNNDKPYNEFIKEQIAGDLLPADSLEQEREQLVACGFLMLGPHNYELQDKALLRMEVVDEQVTTLGKAFLGMTIGCARCHDHKFDPIPTTDYYALAGIFRSTRSLGTGNVTNWVTREMPIPAEQQQALEEHRAKEKELQTQITKLDQQMKQQGARVAQRNVPVAQLAGVVVDAEMEDERVEIQGEWVTSTSINGYVLTNYLHDSNTLKGQKKVVFNIPLTRSGDYEVRVSYTASSNRASRVPIKIWNGGEQLAVKTINQKRTPKLGGGFESLGIHSFSARDGQAARAVIEITTEGTNGVVIADAVQLIPAEELKTRPILNQSSFKTTEERSAADVKRLAELKVQSQTLKLQLEKLQSQAPSTPPSVMAVEEQAAEEMGDMELCIRGNIRNLGPVIPRGVLSVTTAPEANVIQTEASGRLELAKWLASVDNPLTARVMVNRVWAHLFGLGIVRTVDNFGSMGELPSHPELLDHLASEFVENQWSVKQLIRTIVLSRTYQTSSQTTPAQLHQDPENRLLSHFPKRRADAEYLRDALLTISGQLDGTKGGPTVPAGTGSEFGYVYKSRRRSVYLPVFRNNIEEMLRTFNFPDPNLVQGQRTSTTLATQALYLMNHPTVVERAQQTAERVLSRPESSDTERLDWLYLSTVGRRPTASEQSISLEYLQSAAQNSEIEMSEIWASLSQALFNSIDFRYIE